jgi:spermidine/putrescine-binding protein
MFRTLLTAAAALTLMSGIGFAQSSSSSSTTVTTPGVAPTHDADVTTTIRRTADQNGVMIENDTSGTEVSTPGSPTISRTTTNTTTVR